MTRCFAALAVSVLSLSLAIPAAFAQAEPPKEAPKAPAKEPEKKPDDKPAAKQPETKPADKEAPKEQTVHVQLKTSMGDIVLELDAAKAPLSVENFVKYVEKGHYDGTIFHRVIDRFMVQGGGFTADMTQKPTDKPIKNEWKNGLKNKRGTVAMARTQVADSATSQFFINVVDNAFLDEARDGAAYAVFGKVISGMDVVDKIKLVKTGMKAGMGDVPLTPIVIEKAKKLTAEEAAKFAAPEKK